MTPGAAVPIPGRLGITYPRVQQAVQQVHQKIDRHDGNTDNNYLRLNQWVVPMKDSLNQCWQPAQMGQFGTREIRGVEELG